MIQVCHCISLPSAEQIYLFLLSQISTSFSPYVGGGISLSDCVGSLLLFTSFIEGQCDHLRGQPSATNLYLYFATNHGMCGLDIPHTDIFAHRWAGRSTGKDTYLPIAFVDGVAATRHAPVEQFNADE